MEIATHLVLSTGHISAATAELLDRWTAMDLAARPLSVASTDYGWFVSTYMIPRAGEPIPPELDAIIALARKHGCAWILLDRDGGTIAELPIFNW
jgi:hypothetical protein